MDREISTWLTYAMPQNHRMRHHLEDMTTKHGNVSVEIERTPPKSSTFSAQYTYVIKVPEP